MNKEELLEHINKTNKHNNSDGLYDYMKREIERLNNIINRTEEFIEKEYDNQKYYGEDVWLLDMVMDKIKELKGE